jgi:malate dehydrogenase (oxaloacetate-decarboxylating)(NADP+)
MPKILRAAQIVFEDASVYPILLGEESRIKEIADQNGIDIYGFPIFDTRSDTTEEKRFSMRISFEKERT